METQNCQIFRKINYKFLQFLLPLVCTNLVLHCIKEAQYSREVSNKTRSVFDFNKHITIKN